MQNGIMSLNCIPCLSLKMNNNINVQIISKQRGFKPMEKPKNAGNASSLKFSSTILEFSLILKPIQYASFSYRFSSK